MKKYRVSEECIGCRACVEVAGDNFDILNENGVIDMDIGEDFLKIFEMDEMLLIGQK